MPLHTDAGLLIGMVPPLYVVRDGEGGLAEVPDAEAAGGGLEVQLHDGQRARLPAALAAGSLIIMLGDGWHQWINPGLRFPLRPAPHAMSMPRLMPRPDADAKGDADAAAADAADADADADATDAARRADAEPEAGVIYTEAAAHEARQRKSQESLVAADKEKKRRLWEEELERELEYQKEQKLLTKAT